MSVPWHNSAKMQRYGLAVLRLAMGAIFVVHGARKLFGVWGGAGLGGTAASFTELGLSPAYPLALLAGLVEFIGGVLLVFGGYTRVAAAVVIVNIAATAWKTHARNGLFTNFAATPGQADGDEFALVAIAALVSLVLTGGGAFSMDRRRARTAEAKASGRARLRAGKV